MYKLFHKFHNWRIDNKYLTIKVLVKELRGLRFPSELNGIKIENDFKHQLYKLFHKFHNWRIDNEYLTIKVLAKELRELRFPSEIEWFKNRK